MNQKKLKYQKPRIDVVETLMCSLICASIDISDEEYDGTGRSKYRMDEEGGNNPWERGLWGDNTQ
jgi:hypothetical protein